MKQIKTIYSNIYQFTDVLEPMKLSMHQYLLLTEEPVLVQTGAISQAKKTLPQIKEVLGDKPLKYILISHFESDECGGIALVLKEYPNAICICSEVTARQLWGFGLAQNIQIVKPEETFNGNDFEFKIIGYPSEMHMWEGVLFFEAKRGIFFSSDLMFQIGETHGQVIECNWNHAINTSGADQLPSIDMQKKLISNLEMINPVFVASGHGPCMKIVK
ncbi:MBL fold metallo-hydrolase [Clostridium tyrobutyricum]|uniref:MBL fold metallo-hydrolase n=1 Tax=Clostridium tyrobutyricum TaxID=1519 RepID=UPI0011CA3E05|nr:MBL fold metallo-hydrolase [Clostridium tyrobutyricum]